MATTAEYGLGDYTYPRGWFMVGESAQATKKPTALRFFGEEMLMYRGESGQVVVMGAYCPHMGTHIAKNETSFVVIEDRHVEGDSIRCPYHGWRFGPDGKCNEIPYSPAPIPEKACIQSWPVREWGNCVFIWHDPEAGAPDYDLPDLPEWEDKAWVNWKIDNLGTIACHPQEVLDNMADKAHLGPIHGSTNMQYFENVIKDHVLVQHLGAGHATLTNDILYNDTWYTGPGLLMSRMNNQEQSSLMMITNTPVDDGVVHVWHGLLVKSPNEVATDEDIAAAREYQDFSCQAFSQDFEVWTHKAPVFNILQVVGDGPFGKARSWYKQFYTNREKAKTIQQQVNGNYITKGTTRDPF